MVLRRWLRRTDTPTTARTTDDDVPFAARDLAERHLLLVPSTVRVDDVDALVRARVRGAELARDGEVQLGRHSRLVGPFQLSMEEAVDAAVPMPWTVVYVVESPVEREDPPMEGTDDRDGFAFAFPEGLPWRDEGRALHLLVSLARRLHGAVRTAGTHALVTPDPDRAMDFFVHAPFWLDAQVLAGVVARELPTARLAVEGADWSGPPDEAYSGEAIAEETAEAPLSQDQLDALHAHADAADLDVMSGEDVIDAYAVVGEVGPGGADGAVEVVVHVAEEDEVAVADQEWAGRPFVTYEIRWVCPDPADRERRVPEPHHVASRERVRPVLRAVTHAVVEATSGVVCDEDGFLVDRYSLL